MQILSSLLWESEQEQLKIGEFLWFFHVGKVLGQVLIVTKVPGDFSYSSQI